MSNQNIKSDLLVELSTDQQQRLSGGQIYSRRPIICYTYGPYESYPRRDVDVDVDVDYERRRRPRY